MQKLLHRLDIFQRAHPVIGFPLAVIKKYGDDSGSYQAALITYYGFLSLFPLLLVLTTTLQLIFNGNPHLQHTILEKVSAFFPLLGDQIASNIGSPGKTGIALIIATLLTLYGARGVADALRFALDNIWQVPKDKRPGFPKAPLQSLAIIGLAGIGFAVSLAVGGMISGLSHSWWANAGVSLAGFAIATLVIASIFRVATAKNVAFKEFLLGAALAALLSQLLLTFGSILVAHELKNMSSLYGTFAVVLGLLFWIYLVAQVIMYCAQVDTVRVMKLWPRALVADNPTSADKRAYHLYARTEERIHKEEVKTRFSA